MQSALQAERQAIAHHQLFSSPAQFDPKVEIIYLSARGLTLHDQRKHKWLYL